MAPPNAVIGVEVEHHQGSHLPPTLIEDVICSGSEPIQPLHLDAPQRREMGSTSNRKGRSRGRGRLNATRTVFEALKKRFEEGRQRIEAEKLRGRASTKLKEMVRLNKTRADYQERLQRLIDEYNSGSLNLETYFENLLALVQDLAEEDRRTISEGLTEEELALFDILTRPEIPLAEKEKDEVKRVSRNLLETLKKGKLVLDWRKRQQARASVRVAIETGLDKLPESFTDRMYWSKVETVYQHVYDSYYGSGKSLYSTESIN